ncbi:Uncharacterized protein dnm_069950 [Desulfonema magnum]|uniref:Uncharacterized protein n=1 Tax=Desulfonema magnum TaxID=45655 RepID=A0A975BSM3_9BACT|nr:Uncharacterized protein dnm_069950 [Desulfonema magnum]
MSAGRFSETISPKCGNAGHFRPAMQKSCRTILEKLPFFWFILFLSYKCARRSCEYCYSFDQVGDENTMEMDENTFSRLSKWIPEIRKVNNVKVNVVNFLGGSHY